VAFRQWMKVLAHRLTNSRMLCYALLISLSVFTGLDTICTRISGLGFVPVLYFYPNVIYDGY